MSLACGDHWRVELEVVHGLLAQSSGHQPLPPAALRTTGGGGRVRGRLSATPSLRAVVAILRLGLLCRAAPPN
eukprot:1616375-Alexandrium_andersonii.AAC.1